MNSFQWTNAGTIEEIFELRVKGAAIKAGGVDLVDLMKEGIARPTRVVNIRNIPQLSGVTVNNDGSLKIGPLTSLSELADHPVVLEKFTALAHAAGEAATPQIRNMASVGGNILQRPRCWYFRNEMFPCRKKGGEICYSQEGENQYHAIFNNGLCAIVHPSAVATPLVAMDAAIELTSESGKRVLALSEFLTLPMQNLHAENSLRADEILTEIRVPPAGANSRSIYLKQAQSQSHDWPLAEVVVAMQLDGTICRKASVVLGAAAPVPHRATEAEALINGQPITADLARRAAKAALRRANPMSQNRYKLAMFEATITRGILAAAGIS